jgi:MoxR-like ATPase
MSAEATRERLVALINEALNDPDEGVEVTEEWWRLWRQDSQALHDFISGRTEALLVSPRRMKLLNEYVLAEPPIPPSQDYWNAVRERLRRLKPPSLDD